MLDEAERKKFRSLAVKLDYLTRRSWKILKKASRYLEGAERVWKHDEMNVDVRVVSDWRNGPERKSTSGCMMMVNGTAVIHWSRTQATRALSTADAE